MHLVVDAQDVERAHKITEKVETILQEKYSPIRVIIHVEPLNYQSDSIFDESIEDGHKTY